jgi:hypothetical protein
MNTEEIREHQIKKLNKYSQPFRRLFGCEITGYYTPSPTLYVFDIFRCFADLHIPPGTNMRDYIRRKYGPTALDLIDKLF